MTNPACTKPLLRGHFHQAMFFIFIGALVPLILRTTTSLEFISIFLYGICTLLMFGMSALYHRINWKPKARLIWKKCDHAGIYLMIAGSCTPTALLGLRGNSALTFLAAIWVVAGVGVLQSFFFVHLPKIVSALIYIGAGFLVTPYLGELARSIGHANMVLLILGGTAYTIGALCYGLKWPKLSPKYFGYHEVFHVFVNFGAAFHFFAINNLVKVH